MNNQGWVSVQEVADHYRVTSNVVRQWIRSGLVPAIKLGKSWRLDAKKVRAVFEGPAALNEE